MNTPGDKITMDDYSILDGLSRYAKHDKFKENVNRFFWEMIIKSD
jgi:hypothetical protein